MIRPATNGQAARLYERFEHNAERPLLLDARSGVATTYGQLLEDSRRLASLLEGLGVRPGDPVVLALENCWELAALYLACWHVGARAVPIHPADHPRDYGTILEGVAARAFFTTPAVRARLGEVVGARPGLQVHCLLPAGGACPPPPQGLVNLDLQAELRRRPPCGRTFADAADDFVACTMFTSGSSGVPKGVNLRLGGLLANGRAFCDRLGLGREHRFYNVLPLTYLGGLYNLMLIPILAEGSFVLDAPFGPTNAYGFWEQVRQRQINTLWFSPTMLSMLLMLDDGEDLAFLREQVRCGICGMAPLPVDLKKRFEDRFGFRLFENYGLSETTFLTTEHPARRGKPGSVGTPLEGVAVAILDPARRPLPAGREGQIAVQTPYLMAGYEREGDARWLTASNQGYFLTGDLGYLDDDGELYITGRTKDLIIRGGVNISPKRIEDVVYRLDSVQEAAVVGVPHPMYGEEVALVVKARESCRSRVTVEELERYCDAHLAHFQRPKFIYFIDEIPKGATGKIQKGVLRRLLLEKLDPLAG